MTIVSDEYENFELNSDEAQFEDDYYDWLSIAFPGQQPLGRWEEFYIQANRYIENEGWWGSCVPTTASVPQSDYFVGGLRWLDARVDKAPDEGLYEDYELTPEEADFEVSFLKWVDDNFSGRQPWRVLDFYYKEANAFIDNEGWWGRCIPIVYRVPRSGCFVGGLRWLATRTGASDSDHSSTRDTGI